MLLKQGHVSCLRCTICAQQQEGPSLTGVAASCVEACVCGQRWLAVQCESPLQSALYDCLNVAARLAKHEQGTILGNEKVCWEVLLCIKTAQGTKQGLRSIQEFVSRQQLCVYSINKIALLWRTPGF